jgi:uncharacterized protein
VLVGKGFPTHGRATKGDVEQMPVEEVNTSKCGGPVVPSARTRGALAPLGHDAVRLDPRGLLGSWQERTLEVTIPRVLDRIEAGEARQNLARLIDPEAGPDFDGMVFTDSDVYKALEAVAWAAIRLEPGDERLDRGRRLVELVARVQADDGYVNSFVQGHPDRPRWADPQWGHELYTAGHLFQAAVAAERAGVLPGLLTVATRFADLLVARFGPAGPQRDQLDGHPQVETALVELFRTTGDERYLELAGRQLELRGHRRLGEGRFGSDYFQDSVPVRSATVGTGHAVRQVYLLTGAVDVAVETGDDELAAAVLRVWGEMSATKTYVTGALGSRHRDEAIGDPHELPPDRAYAETCAAIASFQLNWRLLLLTGRAVHADAMETVLYNAIAASTSIEGDRFFYSNPLHLRTGHEGSHEDAPTERRPWFSCACCPPNVARLLASVHDYLLTGSPEGIQIHHPTALSAQVPRPGGEVRIDLRTGYPYDGVVELDVEAPAGDEWTLSLRIPSWCRGFQVEVDGAVVPAAAEEGYLHLRRDWGGRTAVRLDLRMPVRRIAANPRVDAVRGCVALARGPVVHALEDADLPAGVVLEDVRLLQAVGVGPGDGAPALEVLAVVEKARDDVLYTDLPSEPSEPSEPGGPAAPGLPGPAAGNLSEPFPVRLGPYHRWANRTPGAMRVWIPLVPAPAESTRFKEETS